MRKLLMVGAVLASVVFPAASQAQASKFQLGLRLGYGGATGDAYKDKVDGTTTKMSDGIKSQIPLQLDAMYKVTPEVAVGAYVSYGFAQTGGNLSDLCDLGDCSTSEWRLGIQGTYAFTTVNPKFVPWLGLGVGYEWSSYTFENSAAGVKLEQSLSGFEFATLQLGGDYKLNPKFSVGPYVTYSFAQYSGGEQKLTIGGTTETAKFSDGADKTMHSWWSVGVAGKFDL